MVWGVRKVMRNIGLKQRVYLNAMRQADYKNLSYHEDKLSWRVCIAVWLFWIVVVWGGLIAWLS